MQGRGAPALSLFARAAWATSLAVAAACVSSWAALAGLAALVVASFAASRTIGSLLRLLPAALALGLFAFAINAIAQSGPPLFPDWPWSPSANGVALGARTAVRLALTGLSFAWLVTGTTPSAAADAMAGPLTRVFGPTGEALGLVGMVALRFGPLAAVEGKRLVRAVSQRAGRKPGPWAARAIAVPLVLSAVRRADRLAYVLAARHWGAARRTPPPREARTWRDAAVIVLGVLLVGAAVWSRA